MKTAARVGLMTKGRVIAAVDEIIDRLAKVEERIGHAVELTIDADGSCSIMAAEEPLGAEVAGFAELAYFDDFDGLWTYLETGEL